MRSCWESTRDVADLIIKFASTRDVADLIIFCSAALQPEVVGNHEEKQRGMFS